MIPGTSVVMVARSTDATHAAIGTMFRVVIDPSGRWLYVANQKGDTIVQFEVNLPTGELIPVGHVTRSVTPVAMVFRTVV